MSIQVDIEKDFNCNGWHQVHLLELAGWAKLQFASLRNFFFSPQLMLSQTIVLLQDSENSIVLKHTAKTFNFTLKVKEGPQNLSMTG